MVSCVVVAMGGGVAMCGAVATVAVAMCVVAICVVAMGGVAMWCDAIGDISFLCGGRIGQ